MRKEVPALPAKKKLPGELPAPVLFPAVFCGIIVGCLAALTGNLLTAMGLALTVPLIVWRPFFGLMALVLLVPIEELTTFGFSFTLLKVLGAVTFICWFFPSTLKRRKVRSDLFLWVALLFLMWSACSLLWAVDLARGIGAVLTIAQLVLLYWMSCNLIDSEENFRSFMGSFVVGAAVASLIAIFAVHEAGFAARASVSSLQDPNRFAHSLSVGLIAAAYLACVCRCNRRYLYIALVPLLALGVFLSGSRGTWMAVLAAIAAGGLFTKSKIYKIILISFLVIIIFFNSLIIGVMPSLMAERISSMTTLADRGSGRLDIWMVGTEMVKDNWLAGVGINSFPTAYNDYIFKAAAGIKDRGVMRDAHNTFLCILAELGLLGFLLFSMFWLVSWKSIIKLRGDPEKTFGVCMLVYLFFIALTGSEYTNKFFWVGLLILNLLPLVRTKGD